MIKKKNHKKDFKRLTKKKKTRKKTLKISTKPSRSAQPKGGLRRLVNQILKRNLKINYNGWQTLLKFQIEKIF